MISRYLQSTLSKADRAYPSSVDVSALAVDGDDAGEIFHGKAVYGFAQEVRECDDLTLLDGVSIQCPGAADRCKINGVIADDGLTYLFAAFSLADHPFESEIQQPGRKGIHARARRGTAAPAGLPVRRRAGAGIIDGLAAQVERKLFSRVQHGADAFMSAVAPRQQRAGEQYALSRAQRFDRLVRQR